ncbi:very-long-chain (3R)-3-hydroxyacyl-CoA dehydratase hpo-8 [Chrysoperla carnea]|uniref:very-long-chain (3R)-3-hydroxyacyl-CoA dehydratase hpo-8 n=1 Tax=Chrysoperla carnea TaxID=189513 RepID=UPI001D074867|nr:very-long-chain (3R)-3-hydroxyacyl-CoA dehydratase hpo-8 [Chrysoperla carnea]
MAKANQNTSKTKIQKKKEPNFLIKVYLLLYNGLQTLGWTYLLFQTFSFYLFGSATNQTLYETIKFTLIIFQNAAVLEILHAATGIVASNPIITLQQVFSRVMLVCGVLMATPDAKACFGLHLCLFAWSVTEIIRYGYYALNILNLVPQILIWLRYTTFIVLYPIGVTGELWCLYSAQNYVAQHNMWSYSLPNLLNFTFSYQYLLIGIMLLYIPLFPQLYMHMFTQRRKILGSGSAAAVEKQKTK